MIFFRAAWRSVRVMGMFVVAGTGVDSQASGDPGGAGGLAASVLVRGRWKGWGSGLV